MKKLLYLIVCLLPSIGFLSCNNKEKEEPQKWEYKTLVVTGLILNEFGPHFFPNPSAKLDSLGASGWELVSVCTKVGTTHPNFGNKSYVTGLQPHIETTKFYYYFKRPIISGARKDQFPIEELKIEWPIDSNSQATQKVALEI